MKALSLHLLALLFLFSCGTTTDEEDILAGPLGPMVQEASELNEGLRHGRILRFSSDRDRRRMEAIIRDARSALMILAMNPDDERGILLGARVIKERENIVLGRSDDGITADFFDRFSQIIYTAAQRNNLSLGNLEWRLYLNSFASGVAPFGLFSTGSNWATGSSLDESYISVQGPSNRAWLISPSFDLTNVENPSFKLFHRTRADRNDRFNDPFNRPLINQEVFRAYVSTDYQHGDPEQANWSRVSLAPLPSGVDFHTVSSPRVSLKDHISPNTTVALVFNADPDEIGTHWINWTIFRFELFGRGALTRMTPRAASLFTQNITNSNLNGLGQIRMTANSPEFEPFGFVGRSIQFARIGTNRMPGESWLFSPLISVRSEEIAQLELLERVFNPNFDIMQVLVSKNYCGGDPNLSDWTELKRTNIPDVPDSRWTTLNWSNLDITDFIGEDIVVAFRFVPTASDNMSWQIEQFSVNGIGVPLEVRPLEIEFIPDWQRDLDRFSLIKEVSFEDGLGVMTPVNVSGDPAEWEITTRNDSTYLMISGHQSQSVGTTRLVSDRIELNGKSHYIQIRQALNFYPVPTDQREKVRLFLQAEDDSLHPLIFDQSPTGQAWTIISSEQKKIPDAFNGQNVRVILEYSSDADIAPNWNIHWIRLFEGPEED